MSIKQKYRLRAPASGRELVSDEVSGERIYTDPETGEELEVVAKLLPLNPSPSHLPHTIENLRICPHCEEFVARDLNQCPYCERRLPPLH